MAMLAERKQKQRWCLNPRGKHWSEDANKFGQKMLEKMGWSSGKGLGAKEDGMTDHVKIGYKNDAKGIGFKDKGEQWTKHEVDFTSLLANLGAGQEAKEITLPKAEKSLVKKSQASRARVHYKKFTRGKDLTQRSEKDLANIFGRKTLEIVGSPEIKPEQEEELDDKNFGVVTVKAGNMADYFKSKLFSFSKFGKASPSMKVEKVEEESESEIGHLGFGFSKPKEEKADDFENTNSFNFTKIQFVSAGVNKETEDETTAKRKRKLNDEEEEECSNDKESKRSKKKKLAFDNLGNDVKIDEEMCFDNPCLNDNDNTVENLVEENIVDVSSTKEKKKVTFSSPIMEVLNKSDESNDIEIIITKKDKKKKKKIVEQGIDNPACEENEIELLETVLPAVKNFKVETKKSKKKKNKQEVGIDNLACEEISVNEKNEEIRRYNLKKQAMKNGLENPACEENLLDDNEVAEVAQESKKKSKKSKKRRLETVFEDSSNSSSSSSSTTAEEETNDCKKKKKRRENNDVIEVIVADEEKVETLKLKKKKKKSTGETIDENGITNLACEINTIEEGIATINDEIDNFQTELENEMNLKKIKKLEPNSPAQNIPFNTSNSNKNSRLKTGYGEKKTLKDDIKSGNLRLGFQGTNLMKLVGYGAAIQLKAQKL